MPRPLEVILSCEHASKAVPPRYRRLFAGHARMLESHRGWDPGALELARDLAATMKVPLAAGSATRLLVDLNRSLGAPTVFSELSARLSPAERARLLATLWRPHRRTVEKRVARAIARGSRVLHLSVHTFTPVFHGVRRSTHVGLLFDPARPGERAFARAWRRELADRAPRLVIRDNDPYSGRSDALVTDLRKVHGDGRYLGFELEVNQRFPRRGGRQWRALRRNLIESFEQARARSSR